METMTRTADAPPAVATAIERMHDRGQEIAQRECERALERLQSQRELSESDRRIVRQLADGLVEELLAVPEQHLREADGPGADEVPAVELALFGDEQ